MNFHLDMCACDSDLAGQDGLALENTNEASQPKMARQRYDQQGVWASGKCMKYRRWAYRHNVFPCGCPAVHLLVSRPIASSTWRRQGFSRPPVCDTVFASLSVPCADLFVHEVGKNVWQLHRGLEITSRFSSPVYMYDIDRFTGFGRVLLSSGRVGTSPKSQFPSVGQISNGGRLWTEHRVDLPGINSPW